MKKILSYLLATIIFSQSFANFNSKENGKEQFNLGLISFVNSIKPAFESNGKSLESFKTYLIGSKNLESITTQGDALLSKAYELLLKNADNDQIILGLNIEFGEAMKYVLENSKEDEIKNIGESASVSLFGGNFEGLNNFQSSMREAGGCKWYQIGCHLNNLWDWIVDHKDDIKTVSAILGYISMFCYYSPVIC